MRRTPRVAEWLVARFLPGGERSEIVGDLAEGHARRAGSSRFSAWHWYWRQAVGIVGRIWWRRRHTILSLLDVRYAVRGLRQSPGFAAIALLSLALGIGANTALFSIVRSVIFVELPVERPEELELVYYERPRGTQISQYSSSGGEDPVTGKRVHSNYSYAIYEAMREAMGDSGELLGFNFVFQVAAIIDGDPATKVAGQLASGDYFSVLGLGTVLGRPLGPDDDRPGAPNVTVLSHAYWQRAFAGDPEVIGRSVTLNGAPFEVVGVTPPGFEGLSPGGFFSPTDVTVPLVAQPLVAPRWTPAEGDLFASNDRFWVRVIARFRDDTTREPVRQAMTSALRGRLLETEMVPEETIDEVHVRFLPGSRGLDSLRSGTERPITILGVVVAAVLLIACVNLASLLLARGAARQRELAVRRAIGASRARLVRQLFIESLVLSIAGGAAGLILALWSGPAVTAALTASMGRIAVHFQLDWQLLAVTTGVSILAALLCGLFPAVRISRTASYSHLAGRTDSSSRFAAGRFLIAAQIAISVPLIVGAGLFLQTIGNLDRVDPGFDTRDLTIFHLDTSLVTSDPDRANQIFEQVSSELEQVPGVQAVTLLENALVGGWTSNTRVTIGEESTMMYMNAVDSDYFDVLGIELLGGRAIMDSDTAEAPMVAVVNETAERTLFDGRAVGRTIEYGRETRQIVGVAADTKYHSLRDEVEPTFFDPYRQRRTLGLHVAIRSALPMNRLAPSIREIVTRADAGLPVSDLRTQSSQMAAHVSRERVFARLLAVFSMFALLIACIGLHGVTSFAVARRRAEMGVRLAMGARPDQILWMVVRQVLLLAGLGLAVGLMLAYWLTPVIGSMLYGLQPTDTATLAGAGAIMLIVAVAAGWIPALRAARTDALTSLATD